MVRASEVVELPVVSIDGGEDIAEIKDVVFDGVSHRLIGFTLNKRGFFSGSLAEELPTEHVWAIGPDAVMVTSAERLVAPGEASTGVSGESDTYSVGGSRVLTSGGDDIGEIVGVILSTGAPPEAVGYEVRPEDGDSVFVPISAQMALSDSNLLVPAEATEFIRNDLAGFGAAVTGFRAKLDAASPARGGGQVATGTAPPPPAESETYAAPVADAGPDQEVT